MSTKNLLFYALLLLLFYGSCSEPGLVFEQKINILNKTWDMDQVPNFSWNISDSTSNFDLILTLEHHPDLNFKNIYVNCKTSFPDSSTKDQILSLEIYDESGKPFGNCSNSNCSTEIMLQHKIRFPFYGNYHLALEQYSRENMLSNIYSISFKILKLEKSI